MTNPTIFVQDICGHFDVSVWPGENNLAFQYQFSTIQGMSTDITLQTPANTSDTHKHHSYTTIIPTPLHPSPTPTSDITRHIQTTKEANTYQQTPGDVNRHFQASAILKQHLGGSGDVRECLLVQLVSVDFN